MLEVPECLQTDGELCFPCLQEQPCTVLCTVSAPGELSATLVEVPHCVAQASLELCVVHSGLAQWIPLYPQPPQCWIVSALPRLSFIFAIRSPPPPPDLYHCPQSLSLHDTDLTEPQPSRGVWAPPRQPSGVVNSISHSQNALIY